MKLVLLALLTFTLASFAGCQSDMTGAPYTAGTVSTNPGDLHPNVPTGDNYFDTMIGRYDLANAK